MMALLEAEEAQKLLVERDRSSMEAWEDDGQQGLRLLGDRYCSILLSFLLHFL
jgi:hypothetical protein